MIRIDPNIIKNCNFGCVMINILRRKDPHRRKGGKVHYIFSEKVRIFLKEEGRWGGGLYFQDFQAKSLGTYY